MTYIRYIRNPFDRLVNIVRIIEDENSIRYIICGPDNIEELVYVRPK